MIHQKMKLPLRVTQEKSENVEADKNTADTGTSDETEHEAIKTEESEK